MKKLLAFLILIGITQTIKAQCPDNIACESVTLRCSAQDLAGPCVSNSIPNTSFPTANLCLGTGTPTNLLWGGFYGNGQFLTLTITVDLINCSKGLGLQAGIMENCGAFRVLDCDASCSSPTITLSGLTKLAHPYYLWIDGCDGDICPYDISIQSGGQTAQLPRPMPSLILRGEQCECNKVEAWFLGYPTVGSPTLTWEVDGIPVNNVDDVWVVCMGSVPTTVCVTATIGNPHIGPICDQDQTCIEIIPIPAEQHFGMCQVICDEDVPYNWLGTIITASCINPPCSARTQLASGCCVDSFRSIVVLDKKETGKLDTFILLKPPLGIPFQLPNMTFTSRDICHDEIEFLSINSTPSCPTSSPFCDTSVLVDVRFFDYKLEWAYTCQPCDGEIILSANMYYDPDCPSHDDGEVTIALDWFTPKDSMIFATTRGADTVTVSSTGEYCVYIKPTYKGRSPGIAAIECFTIPDSLFPQTPLIIGDTVFCRTEPTSHSIKKNDTICNAVWWVKDDQGDISFPDSLDPTSILIDWTKRTADTVEICTYVINDCLASDTVCIQLVECISTGHNIVGRDGHRMFYSFSTQELVVKPKVLDKGLHIKIYDVSGQLKYAKFTIGQVSQRYKLDLLPGAYIVVLDDGKQQETLKFAIPSKQ